MKRDETPDDRAYEDWECPACGQLNDVTDDCCVSCSFTTTETDGGRSRVVRWLTAVVVGAVGVVAGLSVLVVGVQTLDPGLVPLPVLTGMGIVTVGLNLAVDSLDW